MEARRGNYIEDYARTAISRRSWALAKYGGEIDHAIESSLVEARDAIEGGAMLLLGERGTPEDMQQLRAITDGCALPWLRVRATLSMRGGCAASTRPSPS